MIPVLSDEVLYTNPEFDENEVKLLRNAGEKYMESVKEKVASSNVRTLTLPTLMNFSVPAKAGSTSAFRNALMPEKESWNALRRIISMSL